jgi:hypothetical protein
MKYLNVALDVPSLDTPNSAIMIGFEASLAYAMWCYSMTKGTRFLEQKKGTLAAVVGVRDLRPTINALIIRHQCQASDSGPPKRKCFRRFKECI